MALMVKLPSGFMDPPTQKKTRPCFYYYALKSSYMIVTIPRQTPYKYGIPATRVD